MLCPRCSAVFDKKAAKTFESSESTKKANEAKGKEGIVSGNIPFIKLPFRRNQYVPVDRSDTDSTHNKYKSKPTFYREVK